VRLNQKLAANMDLIPPGASPPLVKPRSIDDVPILATDVSSKQLRGFELRRVAAQVDDVIKQTPDVSAVALIGGHAGKFSITLSQSRLARLQSFALQVTGALGSLQSTPPSGAIRRATTNSFFWRTVNSCALLATFAMLSPVSQTANRSSLRDVAEVSDRRRGAYRIRALIAWQRLPPAVTISSCRSGRARKPSRCRRGSLPCGAASRNGHSPPTLK
jgi:multidrug efflux pump subunit AcrB